jgi:hypothetical protein
MDPDPIGSLVALICFQSADADILLLTQGKSFHRPDDISENADACSLPDTFLQII